MTIPLTWSSKELKEVALKTPPGEVVSAYKEGFL